MSDKSETTKALTEMLGTIRAGYSIPALLSDGTSAAKALNAAIEALNEPTEAEDTCPLCGADIDSDEDRDIDGEGAERTPWTCHECGAEGVQVREIIFSGHESVKTPEYFEAIAKAAIYPDGPRTMYADEAGTVEYKAIGAGSGKWGPQIDRHEAARLLGGWGADEVSGFTIYCREASDVPGLWAGVEAGDLEDGELPEGWDTLEVCTEDGPHTFQR